MHGRSSSPSPRVSVRGAARQVRGKSYPLAKTQVRCGLVPLFDACGMGARWLWRGVWEGRLVRATERETCERESDVRELYVRLVLVVDRRESCGRCGPRATHGAT